MAKIHAAIEPAVQAAVGEVKGAATAPTTDELQVLFQTYRQQADATMGQLAQTIVQQNSTITQLADLLNGKASASSLSDVRQRLTLAETTLTGKADTAYVTQQVQTIAGIDQQQAAALTAFQQALSSEDGLVQGLLSTQTSQANLLSGLRTDVDLKAAAATVSALTGQVTTVRNTVNDPATGLAALTTVVGTKASSTDLTALTTTVNGKAAGTDLTALQTTVSGIPASITQAKQDVKAELLGGAGAAYDTLQELAALELNTDSLAQSLAVRVGGVESLVNNAATGIAALNTALNTKALAADLATTNSKVTQNTTDIGNRLRKDVADSTAFPLGVPAAPSMDKAVQKSELAGGIQRPYRIYQNVAATPTGAYLRGTQQAPITDALGLGQVYVLASVRIKTITAPTLASTISLFKNGGSTAFYSQVVALTNIPAVGKVLDILTLSTSLPADITLPATITASSSNGVFEIIIDGVLK